MLIAAALAAVSLTAQESTPASTPPVRTSSEPALKTTTPATIAENTRVLAAGARFEDPRLALSFVVPTAGVVRVRPRGSFYGVDVESVDEGAYYLYHTTYRIRRTDAVARVVVDSLRAMFDPCELPEAPAGESFVIEARCDGAIGLNEIVREIRLVREGALLHLLHIASRSEARNLARTLLASVRDNEDFAQMSPESNASPDSADADSAGDG
ncbi:MAG: hypothetical protein NXI24_14530 [bacterium]|nr:hypothetical protein [bacterium]